MKRQMIKKTMLVMASVMCVVTGGIGIASSLGAYAAEETANVQTLNGFECAGASVRVDKIGTRFQFNLSGEALSKKALTAGVVYMPYDLYEGDLNAFVKGQEKSLTAEFTWAENTDTEDTTDLVGYTYLDADVIPATMYNRMLVVRGYIEDGDTVYYTETIKTSMAYSAWQGTLGSALTDEEKQSLKTYMGPYTLTYGADETEKISDLYYGESLDLPKAVDGYDVEKWYWDEEKTDDIAAGDYATGSMNIYYELKKFTVSGTLSCADSVDMTKVKIAVDGKEMDATVEANGAYSVSVEPGTHKFTFSCPGYKAYLLNQDVSEDTTLETTELKSDLYEIGKFGTVSSSSNLVPEDDFDGQYTVTGNNYLLMMPNTATTGDFTYTVKATGSLLDRGDKAYAASVSNGTYALSVGVYEWETLVVNLSSQSGAGYISYYDLSGTQRYGSGVIIEMVRTASEINVYVGNALYFTFTSAGITPASGVTNRGWANTFETEGQSNLAGFFGENVKLACGIAALNGEFTATYTCKVEKHVAVSGKITAEGAMLENTTLKVDGFDTPISVNADGTYTASVPEGTHTLMFANGVRVATQEVTLVSGSNTVNVTLVDGTWAAGNYGKITSNNTPALNESGNYTIEGTNQLVVFPNTATSAPFTYEAAISNVTRTQPKTEIGISLTDGNYKLTVGYRAKKDTAPTAFSIGIATVAAQADHAVYLTNDDFGEEVTLKFVVTKESIEFYLNTTLIFTLTSNSFVSKVGNPAWTSGNLINGDNSVKDAYKTRIAGFFAENAKIAVGLNSGLSTGSATATYQCSITKN